MAGTNESVRVHIRFRPINNKEIEKADKGDPWRTLQNTDKGVQMNGNELSLYNIEEHGADNITFKKRKEKFYFDSLMNDKTTQIQAFEHVAQQICDEIIQGYNGTIFVYGQSGSGKTHTMYGPEDKKDSEDIEEMGIIPQSCAYIFQILNNKDHPLVEGMLSYEVCCEFIEIYNEVLKDLLDLNNQPKIKQICVNSHRDEWKVIVDNVQRRKVQNLGQVLKAIRFASKNRTVAGTNLNATSSRSHMVMRLIVKITTADGVRTGVGNFSDLAGSEKIKKTGVKGKRLKEAQSIILSLSTLSRVIEALVEKKLPPFQDSKLTFMLKDSLGGNAKTALLIAASPHVFNRDETVRSLKFGERCRKIQNKAKINSVKTKAQLIKENERLKKQIAKLKSSSNEFVMVQDEKAMEAERQKYESRIKELEGSNEKYKNQVEEINKQKEENDVYHAKIENDYEDLKLQHTELSRDIDTSKVEQETLNKRILEIEGEKEKIQKEKVGLAADIKEVNQNNEQLNVDNQRLKEANQLQLNEIDKLKQEYTQMKQEQANLQNKWKIELDSKKSQFSQQEMKMAQQIESLQTEIQQNNQSQVSMKRELEQNQHELNKRQTNIHQLQDENRKIKDSLNEEKEKNVQVSAENEELKIRIEQLLSQLKQEKMKNEQVELQIAKQKDAHNIELQEQQKKVNDFELQYEIQSNELQSKNNIIVAMKKEHEQEIRNLKVQMQAVADLNKQLQEENETTVQVVDEQKDQLSKHQRQITDIQQENNIIAKQLQNLRAHYSQVIQQQIEEDAKMALEQQRLERERYFREKANALKQREKNKKKRKRDKIGSGGVEYGDDAEDDMLPPVMGMTPGGPSNIEQAILDQFSDKELPQITDNEDEDEEDEEEEKGDVQYNDDEKQPPIKNAKNVKNAKDEVESEEDEDDESSSEEMMDMDQQNKMMMKKVIKNKRDSLKNKKVKSGNDEAAEKKRQWLEKQRELQRMRDQMAKQQAQLAQDSKFARQLYENQVRKHNKAWNQYGVPQMSQMEQERQQKLDEKQRRQQERQKERERRRQQYLKDNFVSADQITATGGHQLNDEDAMDDMESKNKKKGKKKKKKSVKKVEVDEVEDEDQEQYMDPNDGMGLIVMDNAESE